MREEAYLAFRELQSRGMIVSSTSGKDDQGNIRAIEKTVQGPIASMSCTTKGEIYEDNMNRCFLIAVDESAAQTAKIISYQNRKAAGQESGTSMAAPHVAGGAALVLSLYPEWGPDEIKNAFMQTAKKINSKSVFDQGAGIIDLKALVESESLVSPGSISFGLISAEKGIWTKTDTVFVENRSNTVKLYEITAHNRPEGLEMSFKQETLELAPDEAGYFVYTATIDPGAVNLQDVGSPDFGGEITITNDFARYNIPYAFLVGNVLSLQFNVNPHIIKIHNQNERDLNFTNLGNYLQLPLARGTYDVIAYFPGQRIVLRENVVLNGDIHRKIKDTEAVHVVTMKGLDVEENETQVLDAGYWSLAHKQSGLGLNVHSMVFFLVSHQNLRKDIFQQ